MYIVILLFIILYTSFQLEINKTNKEHFQNEPIDVVYTWVDGNDDNHKYKRNQYTEGVSVCSFIIAGILIYWGTNDIFVRLWNGLPINWWGLFWYAIAASIIGGQIYALTNRSKLRKTILYEYEENPEATIEQISQSTGITMKDVQAIVLDLKAEGLLRGKFSSTTGQMTHADIAKVSQGDVPEGKVAYCPNCGTAKVKESAVFCSYCGSKL